MSEGLSITLTVLEDPGGPSVSAGDWSQDSQATNLFDAQVPYMKWSRIMQKVSPAIHGKRILTELESYLSPTVLLLLIQQMVIEGHLLHAKLVSNWEHQNEKAWPVSTKRRMH